MSMILIVEKLIRLIKLGFSFIYITLKSHFGCWINLRTKSVISRSLN